MFFLNSKSKIPNSKQAAGIRNLEFEIIYVMFNYK
jgi:hypothetical protein